MSKDSTGNYAPDKQKVIDAAEGRWDDIFRSLAAELLPFQERPGWHGPCPVHGGEDGFRVFKKTAHKHSGGMCQTCGVKADGFALLMWVNKWSFNEALVAVGSRLRVKDPYGRYAEGDYQPLPSVKIAKPAASKGPSDAWIREALRKIWKATVPLTDSGAEPARLYLRSRGILCWDRAGLERVVRFHPALTYKDEKGKRHSYPAIVTLLVSPSGEGVTVNRLYLTLKGEKAPIRDCKMMFPIPSNRTLPGAAVITSRPSEVIDVAEGLETSLAIETALGLPVWPMVNSYLMEKFVPPPGTKAVRIWADKDRSGGGKKAAEALKLRLWEMGIRAQIKMPPLDIPEGEKSVDWNDVLRVLGPLGFITHEANRAVR